MYIINFPLFVYHVYQPIISIASSACLPLGTFFKGQKVSIFPNSGTPSLLFRLFRSFIPVHCSLKSLVTCRFFSYPNPNLPCVAGNKYPIWIVSDMRRQSDLAWFREHHADAVYNVRIIATEEARKKRGWVFTTGKIVSPLIPSCMI